MSASVTVLAVVNQLLILLLARRAVSIIGTAVLCSATAWAADDTPQRGVTFANDIAQLLQKHCQTCHRPGQAAPMSLLTYEDTRPWAKAIQLAVASRNMPPFHAAGPLGRYVDDPRLTPEEIDTFVAWVDQGAPLGNTADLPAALTWDDDAWPMGEPDLVVKLPRFDLRTDSIDDYVDLYSEYVFDSTLWIEGVAVRPSNRKVLHHANLFLTDPGEIVPEGLISRDMDFVALLEHTHVTTWLPGQTPKRMPEGQGFCIPAGSRLLLNVHFAPTNESMSEEPSVALYFADRTIEIDNQILALMVVTTKRVTIPPGASDYTKKLRRVFETDALITDFTAHMHYRGKSAVLTLTSPTGELLDTLAVPKYDFDWQRIYQLQEPISVPKGTVAAVELMWDNSAENPRNPDPTQEVVFGTLTNDEMGAFTMRYIVPGATIDPPIVVRHGQQIDSP